MSNDRSFSIRRSSRASARSRLKARTSSKDSYRASIAARSRASASSFAEYRQYIPADDISTIDWKGLRAQRSLLNSRVREETNLDCHLRSAWTTSRICADRITAHEFEYGAGAAASLGT